MLDKADVLRYDSSIERFTGEYWIDGKPIYRQVVDFGYLPNGTVSATKTVYVNGITGKVINMYGIAESASYFMIIPSVNYSNKATTLYYNKTQGYVGVEAQDDRSAYYAYIVIEYTKS